MKEALRKFLWGFKEKLGKNKNILVSLGVLALIAVIGIAVWLGANVFSGNFNNWDDKNNNANKEVNNNVNNLKNSLVPRRLDGVLVPENLSNLFPVAVVVENLVAARPQAGLDKAQIVYEALAEGGITRFLAIYSRADTAEINQIGPVRSARPYFVDWAEGLGAMFVHIGGSPQALREITSRKIFDLNQFFNAQYFYTDKTVKAAIEHTKFTSLDKMIFALRDKKKLDVVPDYGIWKFKADKLASERADIVHPIEIDFSNFNYKVEYRYNKENNEYERYQAGLPHKMKNGEIIKTKNILVAYTKTSLADSQRLAMETVGTGDALIFRDGETIKGKWKKDSTKDRLRFYNNDDVEVDLVAGNTWVEIVPTDRLVKFE